MKRKPTHASTADKMGTEEKTAHSLEHQEQATTEEEGKEVLEEDMLRLHRLA